MKRLILVSVLLIMGFALILLAHFNRIPPKRILTSPLQMHAKQRIQEETALSPNSRNGLKRVVDTLRVGKFFPKTSLVSMGKGWGEHMLVAMPPTSNCVFVSYGISNDWSFDSDVSKKWNCMGFLFDPTVNHPAVLKPGNLYFRKLGAPMVDPSPFETISPVKFKADLGYDWLNILKMDCEGCEFQLYDDVIAEDPAFFTKVGQFAIEIHISKFWIKNDTYVEKLGALFHLLFVSGLDLAHAAITHCAPFHESTGFPSLLKEIGYPSEGHCHNYLFGRTPNLKPIKTITNERRMKIPTKERSLYFITYGDKEFQHSKDRLVNQVRDMKIFQSARAFTRSQLEHDPNFIQWKKPLEHVWVAKRGGGYWIWKPYIINRTLYEIKERDVLVYADAGSSAYASGVPLLMEYIDNIDTSNYGILSFQMSHIERTWTTRQLFENFNLTTTSSHALSGQYHSTYIVFVNVAHARRLVAQWLETIHTHPGLVTDVYNDQGQGPYFRDNRHDQSVFSLVCKLGGSVVRQVMEGDKAPFRGTRIRG